MSYLFAIRTDGQKGCCRCGEPLAEHTVRGGYAIKGPAVYATERGWLALCDPCYYLTLKETDAQEQADNKTADTA